MMGGAKQVPPPSRASWQGGSGGSNTYTAVVLLPFARAAMHKAALKPHP